MRIRPIWTGLLLLAVLGIGRGGGAAHADDDDATALKAGAAERQVLRPGQPTWTARVEVPEDAVALHVAVCGTEDVDLYVKRGRPAAGNLAQDADAMSRGSSMRELVTVTPTTDAKLREGTWFITVENPRSERTGTRIEVVALVDRPDGPESILPGGEFVGALDTDTTTLELRTFLPTQARSLVLDIEGAEDRNVRYELSGPGDTSRAGRAPRRIVVNRSESPPGEYALRLERKLKDGTKTAIRVRTFWVYEDGAEMSPGRDPVLHAGEPLTVGLGGDWHPVLRRIRIPVERIVAGFEVEAENSAGADVDLYLRRSSPIATGAGDADYLALSSGPRERLLVGGMRELPKGTYYLEVVLVDGCGPVSVTLRMRLIPLRAGRGTWGDKAPPLLAPGKWIEGQVGSGLPGVTWHRVRVPAGTISLHAVLYGADAPLDMLLIRRTDGSIMRRAMSPRVDERLDHVFTEPPDTPRHFVLGILNRNTNEPEIGYRLALTFDDPPGPPPGVTWPPVMELDDLNPEERVAAATVEITVKGDAGGSGACVTPGGLILTCRHVLETGARGGPVQQDGILVAFPYRFDTAPRQAFIARLVHEDAEKDLALLEIRTDVFGKKLGKDVRLPTVTLGDDEALRLGSPVMVCGYPAEGSARARTPVVLTRGAVAGLERQGTSLRWVKTDAWIGLGHSGGCLVDGKRHLVGIAAATLGPNDVLGLAVPLSAVPGAWLRLIRGKLVKKKD